MGLVIGLMIIQIIAIVLLTIYIGYRFDLLDIKIETRTGRLKIDQDYITSMIKHIYHRND